MQALPSSAFIVTVVSRFAPPSFGSAVMWSVTPLEPVAPPDFAVTSHHSAPLDASQSEAEKWIAERPFDLLITALILEFADSGFIICRRFRRVCPAAHAVILSDVAAKSGLQFNLSVSGAREWIHADAILNHTIRMEQLDSLLSRFSA